MAGKPRLFPDQKTIEVRVMLSEDMHKQLRELAMTYGLHPTVYLRSMLATHLQRLKQTEVSR